MLSFIQSFLKFSLNFVTFDVFLHHPSLRSASLNRWLHFTAAPASGGRDGGPGAEAEARGGGHRGRGGGVADHHGGGDADPATARGPCGAASRTTGRAKPRPGAHR